MSREILLLVNALAHEKNVDKNIVFTALEMALASAAKKHTRMILTCVSRSIVIPVDFTVFADG